jgi:uncharacterized 2Fe-2S/4Fe-4S cluster protein (DUF4445 family)
MRFDPASIGLLSRNGELEFVLEKGEKPVPPAALTTITFLPHNKSIAVEPGCSLLQAAMDADIHINASCGGSGVCGKCRVIIEQGTIQGGISEKLSAADIAKGYRLACQAIPVGDVTARIPVESAVDLAAVNRPPRMTARIQEMDFEQLKEKGLFIPPVEKRYLEIPRPSAQDNLPDVSRMVSFLKLRYDEHRLEVDLKVIRKIPEVLRRDDFKVTATLARAVRPDGKTRVINVQAGDTTGANLAVAVDIGTTTVYGQLIDLRDGRVLAQHGRFNGQISYGEDVISRIVYAEKPGGLDKLNEVIIATINEILGILLQRAAVDPDMISTITLAGNTTMTQLLLKINPRYIRRSPYVPAATLFPPVRAKDLGLALDDHVTALVYPAVSSYVGGDIVAGVMGSGMYHARELTLFMDVGTNAEIVIGNRDWMACAACSAGPAFEGGGITFGMRAAKGAIEDFSLDPATFEPMNITVGRARPRGICGSGLITMVAAMFEQNVLDSQGKFNRHLGTPRIRRRGGIWEYVLAWQQETQLDRDLVITEVDLENLIRAKAAIYAGCMTLLAEVGLGLQDVDRIILAGGFGSAVDIEKAMIIGLLPEMDPTRITYIGNGSLLGAKMSCLTNRIRQDVVEVTRKMTNFELSETPSYMDHYVAALFLPHTDLNRFPRLAQRLAKRRTAGSSPAPAQRA